jgi:hypothetical protein
VPDDARAGEEFGIVARLAPWTLWRVGRARSKPARVRCLTMRCSGVGWHVRGGVARRKEEAQSKTKEWRVPHYFTIRQGDRADQSAAARERLCPLVSTSVDVCPIDIRPRFGNSAMILGSLRAFERPNSADSSSLSWPTGKRRELAREVCVVPARASAGGINLGTVVICSSW